jgi:outer membrane protein TolC
MKLQKISKELILILLLLFVLIISSIISAEELPLDEAIEMGLENNSVIREARNSVQNAERYLAKIMAQQDWQVNLNTNYANIINEGEDNRNSFSISATRLFYSGLNISPEISILEGDSDTTFSISMTQPIYPLLPAKLIKDYYTGERNLLKAEDNLIKQRANSIISWLEGYLNIINLNDKREIYIQSMEKAENNLAEVIKRQEIGDAGDYQLLTARLSLKNARYMLQEAENNLKDARFALFNELGCSDKEEINLTDKNHLINLFQQKSLYYTEIYLKEGLDILISIVEKNNPDLQALLLDREILEQELEWLKEENKPDIDLSGSYNTKEDNLKLGINLSYQLYDSGQHGMNLEDKELEIASNIRKYEDFYKQLKQQLKQHIDNFELSQLALEKERLNLEKSQYGLEVAGVQLEMGLIDYLEYQEYWISAAEARFDIRSLEEGLFLNRLKFIKFINQGLIDEIMEGL